jgi:hypothetical protein
MAAIAPNKVTPPWVYRYVDELDAPNNALQATWEDARA